jgi:peptidoglycan/xylan/chitin deacetylase (PgdA/CDA1 family)
VPSKANSVRTLARLSGLVGGYPFKFFAGLGHILMFHRVLPRNHQPRIAANSYLEVTPEFLDWTISYFERHGYRFVSIGELASGTMKFDKPFVCYTFDDGFIDNLTQAMPVFERRGVPFTLYVTTGLPDRTAVLWWNTLERLVLEAPELSFVFEGAEYRIEARDSTAKADAFRRIGGLIKHGTHATIPERASAIFAQFGIDPLEEVANSALSWDDLRAMAASPLVTLGAHSVTHPVLADLNREQVEFELGQSKARLEQELGRPVDTLAYPFGGPREIGRDAIRIAEQLGFRSAVTTLPYSIQKSYLRTPLFLPRIAVGMSMNEDNFDLLRRGILPLARNHGRRLGAQYSSEIAAA